MTRQPIIGVVGAPDDPTGDSNAKEDAQKLGEGIAKAGAILLCGGGDGIIEEAVAAAKKAGGHTIGILPSKKRSSRTSVEVQVDTDMGDGPTDRRRLPDGGWRFDPGAVARIDGLFPARPPVWGAGLHADPWRWGTSEVKVSLTAARNAVRIWSEAGIGRQARRAREVRRVCPRSHRCQGDLDLLDGDAGEPDRITGLEHLQAHSGDNSP